MRETRKMKVKFMTSSKYPVLVLQGKWLQEAGFDFNVEVEVKVFKGRLTITTR